MVKGGVQRPERAASGSVMKVSGERLWKSGRKEDRWWGGRLKGDLQCDNWHHANRSRTKVIFFLIIYFD